MARCGAKTRSGQPCKSRAMANGRCRMHGGKSTGAPAANKNAAKPGSLYSKFYTDEERLLADQIKLGQVDEELRLTRIRLMRAMAREQEVGGELELDSEKVEPLEIDGQDTGLSKTTTTKKVRDYWALIDRLTARIESLERTRAELAKHVVPEETPVTKIEIEVVHATRENGAASDDGASS